MQHGFGIRASKNTFKSSVLIPIENNGSLQGCILVHKIHAPNCVKKTPYDSSLGSNWHFRAAYHTYDQELGLMPLCQANTTLPSGFPFRPSVWYFRWKKYRHMQCHFFCVRMTDTTPDPISQWGLLGFRR